MALLDQYGKEIKKGRPILEELGVAGVRDLYSTYPSQGLTPERLTAIFKEADAGNILRQAELFEEMEEKDAHLGSVLGTRKLAVAGLEWEVVAASEEKEDERIASFIKEAIEWTNNWDDALLDLLDAVGKGFAVSEIMWEIDGGRVWPAEFKWRHQKKFTFIDRDIKVGISEEPKLITDEQPAYGEELPPNKFIIHKYRSRSGILPRGGILRPCAWMYLFKNYDVKDWVIFNERFAMPMRVGKYAPGTGEEEKKVLRNAVFNLGSDAAAVISDSTVIELLTEQSKRGSADIYEKLAVFCERAMSKAVLGHTGSSDSTPGKLGSEDEARDVRQDLLEADAKALAKTITMQFIRPLVEFNFGPDKSLPIFKFKHEAEEDLEKVAKVYGSLVKDMGFDGIPKTHIYERFGIPMPEEDEETVKPTTPFSPSTPEAMKSCPGCGATRMIMKNGQEGKDAVDRFTDRLIGEASLDRLIDPVHELVENAKSLEEIRDGILELYKDMDAAELGNIIQKALVAAELTGRFKVIDDNS